MTRWRGSAVVLTLLLGLAGCTGEVPSVPAPSRADVDTVIDDWHAAASAADGERYFSLMTGDAVFLGTDDSERWTVEEFREYAHPHFSQGRGWTYVPSRRHVMFSEDGRLAWFDERLDSEKYGVLRGTGVLRRTPDGWRLAHYSMTFAIPNDSAKDVVGLIRGEGG